jgi:nitroreductase
VLVLTACRTKFSQRDKQNRTALHDLGLAVANLTFEATERGLGVHQMAGVKLDKVRGEYGIPEEWEPQTAIAIGYAGVPGSLPDPLKEKEIAPRQRRPINEFVFGQQFGKPASIF